MQVYKAPEAMVSVASEPEFSNQRQMVGHTPPNPPLGHLQPQRRQPTHIDMVKLRNRQTCRVGGDAPSLIKLEQAKARQHALDLVAPVVEVTCHDQRRIGRHLAFDKALQQRNLADYPERQLLKLNLNTNKLALKSKAIL